MSSYLLRRKLISTFVDHLCEGEQLTTQTSSLHDRMERTNTSKLDTLYWIIKIGSRRRARLKTHRCCEKNGFSINSVSNRSQKLPFWCDYGPSMNAVTKSKWKLWRKCQSDETRKETSESCHEGSKSKHNSRSRQKQTKSRFVCLTHIV